MGVGDGWVDSDIGELKKQRIPLVVNDLLVEPHNLKVLLHHIHALIHAPAYGKDTLEHIQDVGVDTRSGGGGTTTASSVGRSGSKSGGASMMSPQILSHCGAKWLMCYILVEFLLSHHLNHELNVWSKATRSELVGGDVPDLIHNVLKDVKAL
jgi:hypothetical protein